MNTLYKNSLLYLLATLSVKAASFILLPFYSYLISPAEYGYIYIVISFVSFMSIMMTFSVSASISRFYIDCEGIVEVRKMFFDYSLYCSWMFFDNRKFFTLFS